MMRGTRRHSDGMILVVDDQATQRLLACEALRAGGFKVLEAASGEEALEAFSQNEIAAIVLDVMMPGMDGFEVCRRIRAQASGEHVPIMVITARHDGDAITQAYDVGATDFVSKPVNPLILIHRMRYMLRGAATAEELRSSETLLAIAEEVALSGSWEWAFAHDTLRYSKGFAALFRLGECDGLRRLEAFYRCFSPSVADEIRDLISKPDGCELPLTMDHSGGESGQTVRHFETRIDLRMDLAGQPVLCGFTQEVTERRKAEGEIRKLAYFDSLTGLPNRVLFTEHLKYLLADSARTGQKFGILHIDIDDFKRINELGNRAMGDEILTQFAERIQNTVRAQDVVTRQSAEVANLDLARLGGDEFIVAVVDVDDTAEIEAVCQRLLSALQKPYELADRQYRLSASIGVVVCPDHGDDIEALLLNADSAMSEAKKTGKDRYQIYSDDLRAQVIERLSIGNDLRNALEAGKLEVYFQPKINIQLNQVVGMEALVRWKHEGEFIYPDKFIPIAEESNVIDKLGGFVMRRACSHTVELGKRGLPELEVSVNVSARELERPTLVKDVEAVLSETGLSARLLCIELTESALMDNADRNVEVLSALRKLGCRVAVDDFGTGYSSLNYLKSFPIDTLKIDRSFVMDLESGHNDGTIVTAVVRLAQTLGLTVVAEGVETENQEQVLRKLGCDEVQGYLYSRPLPFEEFEAWLRDRVAVSTVLRAAP